MLRDVELVKVVEGVDEILLAEEVIFHPAVSQPSTYIVRCFSLRTVGLLKICTNALPSEQGDESESVERHSAVTPVRSLILS